MWIKYTFFVVFGLAGGFAVAAGAFAAISAIGIIPRLAGRSRTAEHILLYEGAAAFGGIWGNIVYLYQLPILGGYITDIVIGLSAGIFVGCLAMALAEILNSIPIFFRRSGITEGGEYVVLALGLGKMVGALYYFFVV